MRWDSKSLLFDKCKILMKSLNKIHLDKGNLFIGLFFGLSINTVIEAMKTAAQKGLLHCIRYQQVILRCEFDKNKCVSDPQEQRRLLWSGQDELFKKKHPIPGAKFARSLGIAQGVAYGRIVDSPDWVLDYWHPLEKAQYPEYFRKRECRKCEYIRKWNSGTLY